MMTALPEYYDGVPNVSGSEALILKTIAESRNKNLYYQPGTVPFAGLKSTAAIALHMHQPLIPAGGADIPTARLICNLQHMMENPGIQDSHNAPVFKWCYERMGEFIPELIKEGKSPRAMLEYSGTLLHGLRKMGADDVFDRLKDITCNPDYQHAVEWLGCPWGHAVAPSTPIHDFRLHVQAFQHHFASIFGLEALARIRGFSPSEMALPNHPDVAYEFVKTLVDCGYQWVLVQEHSIEIPETGRNSNRPHLPHRLVCKNSEGQSAEIIAIIKTQGSDTKLVGQMQPYFEAKSLGRMEFAGKSIPPLVTQVADGENGGVMMNEFPSKYKQVVAEAMGSETALVNVTEYLENLFATGIQISDLPIVQPVHQKIIWDQIEPGCGKEKLESVINQIKKENHQFHMDGGSWTSNISWVKGYDDVLKPMDKASSAFYEMVISKNIPTDNPNYRNALFHLMTAETSCYRYWGQGVWTDYGKECARRALEIVNNDF